MKLRQAVLLFVALIPTYAITDDTLSVRDEAKAIIKTLASREYWGRGYTKDGMAKASNFLERQLRTIGIAPLTGKSYRQSFEYPVNTFPSDMEVVLNGKKLTPGVDYIVSEAARGVEAEGDLVPNGTGGFTDAAHGITVTPKDKLTWSVAGKVAPDTQIFIDKKQVPVTPTHVRVKIKNVLVDRFHADNLVGVVRGTEKPDQYIVLTAHYDHLGSMGREAYFPGANDNASGDSLVLELAKYYAKNPPKMSVVFIFFAGEEAGLLGSKFFVEHPLLDLTKIRFLTNFDLNGTGDTGITVVNATEFPTQYAMMLDQNTRGGFFEHIYSRGKAANSDHYYFTEHGVPAFFIYTMGGIAAYHDVFDKWETLPLTKFEELYHLVIRFNDSLQSGS